MKDTKNSGVKAKGLCAEVHDILSRIDKNFSNPAQLEKSFNMLCRLLDQGSAQWDQVDMDQVICTAMRVFKAYPNQGAILEVICFMLGNVCKSNSTRCARFQKEGGVEAIMRAMHNHKNMATQVAIWCMMSAIAEQKGILGAQQVGYAAKHIAMTMQAHTGDLMAQQVGSNALGSLCLHAFEENIEQELQGNVVRAIVSATRIMCQHDKICQHSLGAMNQLAMLSQNAAKLLLEEGAPGLIIIIMDKILLEAYTAGSLTPLEIGPQHFLDMCCSIVGALFKAHCVKDSQTCNMLIALISRAMLKFVESSSLQCSAMCAVKHVVIPDETGTEYSSKQQVIRAILAGLVEHKEDPTVQHAGMRALATMCGTFSKGNSSVSAGVIADEGLRVLLQHMDVHLHNSSVQHQGIEAITSIATRGDVRMTELLIDAGSVKRIVSAMMAHVDLPYHPDDPQSINDILCTGCEALSKIISPDLGYDARATMVEQGVAEALILAMIRRDLDYATISVSVCSMLGILLLNHAHNIKRVGAAVLHAAVYALQIAPLYVKLQACYELLCILEICVGAEDCRSYQDAFRKCGGFDAVSMCLKICLKNYECCCSADFSFRKSHDLPHVLAVAHGLRDLEACRELVNMDWLDTCPDETQQETCLKDTSPEQQRLLETHAFFETLGMCEESREILQACGIDVGGLSLPEILVKHGALPDPNDNRCEWMARLACQCLYQATLGHEENQQHCGEAIISSVLRVMSKSLQDDRVQEAGSHALYAICRGQSANMDTLKSLGGHAHILRAEQEPYRCGITDDELAILRKKFPGVGMSQEMIRPGDVEQIYQDMTCLHVTKKDDKTMRGALAAHKKKRSTQKHIKSSPLKVEKKPIDACVVCGKTAGSPGVKKLLKCSACTIEPLYCSAECQKASWGAHKAECKSNRKTQ
jgi:hypothetical protein